MSEKENTASASHSTEDLNNKYPTPRGFTGFFWYHVSMAITRILVKLRGAGKENIPETNPYVICSNHQTYADGMWIMSELPRKHRKYFCALAASDLETNYGRLGRVMMHVGRGIAVDRFGNPVRGLIKAKKEVEKGNIILVHPEGTRTSDGRIAEFKDGAAYISVKSNSPLLPVYIEGGYQAWSRHMKRPQTWDKKNHRKKRITIHFGKPLMPQDYDRDAHKMTDAVYAWMKEMEAKDVNLL
ncbi:MAG: 1-acyl-sn-glycerol-3-phosphate acyltransferase [Clostridiales bacterium]|jgi:1-acyl-sn-glycerol-3-phosphate acyltransferase|nr:1-acyl-sn-glycerol-3-phosphate acyltransferase [Clostridiales bacterium]